MLLLANRRFFVDPNNEKPGRWLAFIVKQCAEEIVKKIASGAHGAPYLYPAGDPGPPTLPSRGPWGPPQLCFLPEKNFRRLCRRKFFSASQSSSGAHGAPYFYPVGDPGPPTLARRGPWGPPQLIFLVRKNSGALARLNFF